MGAKLLQDVRQDLADVVQVCEGKKKQTNYLRTLINELVKGTAPPPRLAPSARRVPLTVRRPLRRQVGRAWGSGSEGPKIVGLASTLKSGEVESKGTGSPQGSPIHPKSLSCEAQLLM